jgi:SsrA-binding protein
LRVNCGNDNKKNRGKPLFATVLVFYFNAYRYNAAIMNKKTHSTDNVIALNKKASHEYLFEQIFEAGLVLEGWEIKSLRAGKGQITDSYVIIRQGEAWLLGSHIHPVLAASTHVNPVADRSRKLLLHHAELRRLIGLTERKGYTLVALKLYWKKNRVKLEVALAKGKKLHDKRQTEKDRDWAREKERLLRKK